MKKILYVSIIISALSMPAQIVSYAAVVVSPVADLLLQPMSELKQKYKKGYSYAHIPIGGSPIACPRGHQLRANELVEVIEERDEEVRIRMGSCFYLRKENDTPQQEYWMNKHDIIACDKLPCCTPQLSLIPKPVSIDEPIPNAIILARPWFDYKTKTHFSAGTRFAFAKKTDKSYIVYAFDRSKKRYITTMCPISHCFKLCASDLQTQRQEMIALARLWTENEHGFIPYAWGGCSIVNRIASPHPHEHTIQLTNGNKATYYEWPGKTHTPKTGIDCSGLILLAAQSVGIPYFCKNSSTVEKTLRPVNHYNELEVGDIIMLKGHVMIVADLERNTLIEARGYGDRYGKVHEIPLCQQFKDITTYEELCACVSDQCLVDRLDKAGKVASTVIIKLFKIA